MIGKKNIDRLIVLSLVGISLWLIVLGKLFLIQVVMADDFKAKAERQQQRRLEIPAQRGRILDRNGNVLAKNSTAITFWVEKNRITNLQKIDSVFCVNLNLEKGTICKKILNSENNWMYLMRNVELSSGQKIVEAQLKGVYYQEVYDRVYPMESTASQILGYVDIDGNGLEGIELKYDKRLAGQTGESIVLTDARGRIYPTVQFGGKPPVAGQDLRLTIDMEFQKLVERELSVGIAESCKADNGMAVFLNPSTGEVLAMACYPAFDPNNPADFDAMQRKMRVVTDVFEPGSMFKLVPFAGLLEKDLLDFSDSIFCENGNWFFCDDTIHDAEPHGYLSVPNVLIHSSNIGTIKLSQNLSNEDLFCFGRAFGFGNLTGIDLPGEVKGTLKKPCDWSGMTPAALPMGHEVAVTSIQVASAYGALANHGVLMQPHLVMSAINEHGKVIQKFKPTRLRKVINPGTVDSLAMLMQAVVDSGTGVRAAISGVNVGGKTGTAQKVKENGGGYYDDVFISSFVGFAPVENPQIVGVIVVDNPGKFPHWGGWTAAPIWGRIVNQAIAKGIINIESQSDSNSNSKKVDFVSVPDVRRMTGSQAYEVMDHRDLVPKLSGEGIVVSQSPQAGRLVLPGTEVNLALKEVNYKKGIAIEVPDVTGLTLRKAIIEFAEANVPFAVVGSGIVVEQDPPPGELIDRNEICLLNCKISKCR